MAMANGGDGGVRPGERESEGEPGGRVRESREEAWRCPGTPRRGGEGKQAGREVAWRGGRARAPATRLADWRQEDDGGGGLGWLAGPHREEPR